MNILRVGGNGTEKKPPEEIKAMLAAGIVVGPGVVAVVPGAPVVGAQLMVPADGMNNLEMAKKGEEMPPPVPVQAWGETADGTGEMV